ncbi:hypothetical protein FACS189413_19040 [Bacteroidia bacterium]|nr:hypothetical protein FACS189413_19040 [Bacteroidia bacterium]
MRESKTIDSIIQKLNPKFQYKYNERIHLVASKEELLKGFPLSCFLKFKIGHQDDQFFTTTSFTEVGYKWYIETYIKIDAEHNKVIRSFSSNTGIFFIQGFVPMILFPDNRAYKMHIYLFMPNITDSENGYVVDRIIKLQPHKYHNFAYYIDPDIKPGWFGRSEGENIPFDIQEEISGRNRSNNINVSSINNPFSYPKEQTYQIGDGEILALASQAIATSDGQFGQYPLVCFCTDGIFTLQVGDGSVVYSRQSPIQNYEKPISPVICSTPFGICFVSKKGLCILIGQQVVNLSGTVHEKQKQINLESLNNKFELAENYLYRFIKDCEEMIYNSREEEMIIINRWFDYNLIYSFRNKVFTQSTERITAEVKNSDINTVFFGADLKSLTDYDLPHADSQNIKFITRPVRFGSEEWKQFERIIYRADIFDSYNNTTVAIWGSIDGKEYKLLRGLQIQNDTSRKDIDFGLFGRTSYRYYIFGLSGTVANNTEFKQIDILATKEYDDGKMR